MKSAPVALYFWGSVTIYGGIAQPFRPYLGVLWKIPHASRC